MLSKSKAKQKVRSLFWVIAGLAAVGAIVAISFSFKVLYPDTRQVWLLLGFVAAPLVLESFGAVGLSTRWFVAHHLQQGKIINVLQWVAGILGTVGIFDFVMRLTRKSSWMIDGKFPFVVDGILIVLFVLWLVTAYYIEKDVKERKVCEFC